MNQNEKIGRLMKEREQLLISIETWKRALLDAGRRLARLSVVLQNENPSWVVVSQINPYGVTFTSGPDRNNNIYVEKGVVENIQQWLTNLHEDEQRLKEVKAQLSNLGVG